MKERPILFSAAMVRALLAGQKTQTRRPVKITHRTPGLAACLTPPVGAPRLRVAAELCPYGQPGDRLWVREAWRERAIGEAGHLERGGYAYRATENVDGLAERWRPSIHMPRAASRITLEITDVRVERLQDISEADARAEGATYHDGRGIGHSGWRHDHGAVHADARSAYGRLWNDINGPGSWDVNPWVWVVEFRRLASGGAAA